MQLPVGPPSDGGVTYALKTKVSFPSRTPIPEVNAVFGSPDAVIANEVCGLGHTFTLLPAAPPAPPPLPDAPPCPDPPVPLPPVPPVPVPLPPVPVPFPPVPLLPP